jgi:hypothetical protein
VLTACRDAIAAAGFAHELANYGEYSGAPTEGQTYEYAKTVGELLFPFRSRASSAVHEYAFPPSLAHHPRKRQPRGQGPHHRRRYRQLHQRRCYFQGYHQGPQGVQAAFDRPQGQDLRSTRRYVLHLLDIRSIPLHRADSSFSFLSLVQDPTTRRVLRLSDSLESPLVLRSRSSVPSRTSPRSSPSPSESPKRPPLPDGEH